MGEPTARLSFADIDRVIADPLRFKQRLRIGDDVYAIVRAKKFVAQWWDVGGAAWTGAGVASSATVANTFFGYTASQGLLTALGFGTAAATPIGWVAAAAVVSGGAWLGVSRLFGRVDRATVDTIPRFINTPVDLLGMTLFDLMGALALRIGTIDGRLHPDERAVILDHFACDWGYDPAYLARAMDVLVSESDQGRVKGLAKAVAAFLGTSPDCNGTMMQAELMALLREVASADGVLDEREELALNAVAATFAAEGALTLDAIRRGITQAAATTGEAARYAAVGLRSAIGGLGRSPPGASR